MMNKTVLVIPDGHVDDVHDLSRFAYLGNLIVERKPDMIVQLGDFVTVGSLSHFDMKKSRKMEGMRFSSEMQAGRTALDLLFGPMNKYNEKMKVQKRKKYEPEVIWCEGNHEFRVESYLDYHPHLVGQLELFLPQNLNYGAYPITEIVPYREFITRDGISYTHAPINAACKPTTGKFALYRASEIFATSIVFGHLHRKEGLNLMRHGGGILQVFSAGCFFEHVDDYALGAQNIYWRGVQMLHVWDEGRFDIEEIGIARLKEEYK
jgi:predicted phosphodiesterase